MDKYRLAAHKILQISYHSKTLIDYGITLKNGILNLDILTSLNLNIEMICFFHLYYSSSIYHLKIVTIGQFFKIDVKISKNRQV